MSDVIHLRDPADRERARQNRIKTINQRLNEAEEHILKGRCMKTVAWFLKRQMSKGPTELIRRRAKSLYDKLQRKIHGGVTSGNNPEPAA